MNGSHLGNVMAAMALDIFMDRTENGSVYRRNGRPRSQVWTQNRNACTGGFEHPEFIRDSSSYSELLLAASPVHAQHARAGITRWERWPLRQIYDVPVVVFWDLPGNFPKQKT